MFNKKTIQKPTPSGLVTTMFTDIVSSTQLKGSVHGETSARRDSAYRTDIKAPHDSIILACIQEFDGYVVNSTGDGFCATFVDAEEAVLCALQIQERLRVQPISTPLGPLQIRIGLHTGMAEATGGNYSATTLDKTARVQGQAEGGQVVISRETHALVAGKLQGINFESAGTFDLKGLGADGLYRVELISALSTPEGRDSSERVPRRQKPLGQPPVKLRLSLWLAAALAFLLLGTAGYVLRTRLGQHPLAVQHPQAVQHPPAVLPLGSVWVGSFRFLPPIPNYTGSASLTVTKREGEHFEGIYATEDDKYQWQVNGTLNGNHLHWELTQALKNQKPQDSVGKTYVDGTVEDRQFKGLFQEDNNPNEKAALQMQREK
jgi:class 3 adenylate cyclase